MAASVNNIAATFSLRQTMSAMSVTPRARTVLSHRPSVSWNPQTKLPLSLKSSFLSFYGSPGPKPKTLVSIKTPLRTRQKCTAVRAALSVGEKLPEATLAYLDKENNVQTITVSDLTRGKKVVLVAVPGAFTPTCSQKHLPSFIEKADELKKKGVDTIACVSVNDAFVMKAWGESLNVGDKILLLADGNGEFTKALGVSLDLTDKPAGLGVRSRRYALVAEDGIVKVFKLEEGGAFTVSGAGDILKEL